MKLNTPINLRIETDELAMLVWYWLNTSNDVREHIQTGVLYKGFKRLVCDRAEIDGETDLWRQLTKQLADNGIDQDDWLPENRTAAPSDKLSNTEK
jgi:hypothetical protein